MVAGFFLACIAINDFSRNPDCNCIGLSDTSLTVTLLLCPDTVTVSNGHCTLYRFGATRTAKAAEARVISFPVQNAVAPPTS